MREKNVREINLTKENICFANKISVEDNVIAAECTLLFDVDKSASIHLHSPKR